MAETYPAGLPCVQILPYAYDVNMGVLRTPMDGGYSRQRRLHNVMPHDFKLEFVMAIADLYAWQTWVNQFAYDYFYLPLESMHSSLAGKVAAPTLVRFTTNLSFENVVYGWIRVRVGAELSPIAPATVTPPPDTSGDWIIAGRPATPSTPDTYTAGRPASPSNGNTVIAGEPGAPSTSTIQGE